MICVKQSTAVRPLQFLLLDTADGYSPKTGLSPTVTLSKNGAAFASPAGAVTELAHGWYQVAAHATDSNTLGSLIVHATGTGAVPADTVYEVVAYDPADAAGLGLSRVDVAVGTRASQASLDTVDDLLDTEMPALTSAVAAVQADTDNLQTRLPAALVGGRLDSSVGAVAANAITAAGLDPDVTTELQTGLATAAALTTVDDFLDTELPALTVAVATIAAKTDALPASPASEATLTTIAGYLDTEMAATLAAVDTEVASIKAKTDLIPASPAAVGSVMALDLTQAVPTSNTAQTVGDALNAARAQAFGKWVLSGTSLTLYAANGSTVVRTFTLDSATDPTSRT